MSFLFLYPPPSPPPFPLWNGREQGILHKFFSAITFHSVCPYIDDSLSVDTGCSSGDTTVTRDDRYFILVFPSQSSDPWHYYVFLVRVIRVDIERIPGDRDMRKLPEFMANAMTTLPMARDFRGELRVKVYRENTQRGSARINLSRWILWWYWSWFFCNESIHGSINHFRVISIETWASFYELSSFQALS